METREEVQKAIYDQELVVAAYDRIIEKQPNRINRLKLKHHRELLIALVELREQMRKASMIPVGIAALLMFAMPVFAQDCLCASPISGDGEWSMPAVPQSFLLSPRASALRPTAILPNRPPKKKLSPLWVRSSFEAKTHKLTVRTNRRCIVEVRNYYEHGDPMRPIVDYVRLPAGQSNLISMADAVEVLPAPKGKRPLIETPPPPPN